MNVLRIYFSAQWQDSHSPCPWALCDETGTVLQQGVSPLAAIPRHRECIGILAADRVLIFTTNKPPGNLRRWQAALPFIAEEHALTDPEDLHAVPAASDVADKITVSVISKSWLKQILSATAGRPLRRLIAESLMPTLSDHSWTLVWDGQQGFLRTSMTTGMALDSGDQHTPPLALQLNLAAAGLKAPAQIELRLSDTNTVAPDWSLPVPLISGDIWDWRCAPISDKTPNLLWGEFTPPIRLFDGLKKLRPALYILLAALIIEVAGTHMEWIMLAQEKHALVQQQQQIFRAAFGDDSTLVDAPLQIRRNLAALRHSAGVADDADFISLLDATALLPETGATLLGLNYESGKLELNLKLNDTAAFHSLEGEHNGLRVHIGDKHELADGVEAKLTLSLE